MARAALALALTALSGLTGSVLAAPGRGAPNAGSHCRNGEAVVYSCRFGAKTGSVCLGANSIHYRFGPLGRPEIDLASAPDWSNVHPLELYSQSLAQKHVRMNRGPISYVVYFGEAGRLSDVPGRRISGITVMRGTDRILGELACPGAGRFSPDAYARIGDAAPAGWEGGEAAGGAFDGYF